jgi:hypothetical protein
MSPRGRYLSLTICLLITMITVAIVLLTKHEMPVVQDYRIHYAMHCGHTWTYMTRLSHVKRRESSIMSMTMSIHTSLKVSTGPKKTDNTKIRGSHQRALASSTSSGLTHIIKVKITYLELQNYKCFHFCPTSSSAMFTFCRCTWSVTKGKTRDYSPNLEANN